MSVTSAFAAPWSAPVTIIDGNQTRLVYSDGVFIKDILEQENMELSSLDMVYPLSNNVIPDDRTIIIKRLKPLEVEYAGHKISYWTDAETYREFIGKGTTLADSDDILDVDLDDKLSREGNKIVITKVEHETQYEEEEIPFKTITEKDKTILKGQKTIARKGVNGVKSTAYDVELHNGVEVSRTLVSERVTTEPVDAIVKEGTKVVKAPVTQNSTQKAQTFSVSQTGDNTVVVNGQTIHFKKSLTCQATAYDLSYESCGKLPGSPGFGITASGTYAKVGTVAVDPRVIPLGTKMFIVSSDGRYVYGYCTAEDTGGGIKGNKVDLFYNTRAECLQFGRRSVIVYIL